MAAMKIVIRWQRSDEDAFISSMKDIENAVFL